MNNHPSTKVRRRFNANYKLGVANTARPRYRVRPASPTIESRLSGQISDRILDKCVKIQLGRAMP